MPLGALRTPYLKLSTNVTTVGSTLLRLQPDRETLGGPLLLCSHSTNHQIKGKVRTEQTCTELTEAGMDKIIKHSHQVPTI